MKGPCHGERAADATRALVERLGQRIRTLPDEAVLRHADAARRLVEAIDPKDVAYVAATLAVGGVLWTHDRHLGAAVPVVTTRDLLDMGER